MAQKVRLGGELDPRTVEGIAADAKTIIDRKNGNKRQDDMNAELAEAIAAKQATLVSGTNIKTINNQSILGSGNIEIQGGGGSQVQSDWNESDSSDPAYIKNKPTIPDPNDFATAAQGALADTAYQKPSGGIPATDLASAVQTSLNKANSAQQPATTLAGYGITDAYSKAEGLALENEIDSRLDSQDNAISLLNGNDVVVVDDHTAVQNPDTQKIYREPYKTELLQDTTDSSTLIDTDYYDYVEFTAEPDTVYNALDGCVFIEIGVSVNTVIGATLTLGAFPSGSYAVGKIGTSTQEAVSVSYTKTNDGVTPTKYTDWMCVDNTSTPVVWKKIGEYTFPGIDNMPTENSDKLVKSGGVYAALEAKADASNVHGINVLLGNLNFAIDSSRGVLRIGSKNYKLIEYTGPVNYDDVVDYTIFVQSTTTTENPEYQEVIVDSEDRVLYGVKTDGAEYWPQEELVGYTMTVDGVTETVNSIIDNLK